MRVFLLFSGPFPQGLAGVQHVVCESLGLSKCLENFKLVLYLRTVNRDADDGSPEKGTYKGIKYEFINGKIMYSSKMRRRITSAFALLRTFVWGIRYYHKNDIVYCFEGLNSRLFLFMLSAKIKGAKFVREIVEIPYYNMSLSSRWHRWFEGAFFFPHYDGVVSISHPLNEYASQHVSKKAQLHIQPILVQDEENTQYDKAPFDFPYIIHTGTMYEQKDGISYILKAFSEFKKTDCSGCKLVFAGPHSNDKCSFLPMINELGIGESVVMLGMINDRERLTNLQHFAAMSIVYRFDNLQTRYGFSTKIGEFLMSGAPLITTNVGEQEYYLKDRENAFVVEPYDIHQLAITMGYIMNNPEESRAVGLRGRKLAQDVFNPIHQGERLMEFFKKLLEK